MQRTVHMPDTLYIPVVSHQSRIFYMFYRAHIGAQKIYVLPIDQ